MIKKTLTALALFSLLFSCKTIEPKKEETVLPANPFQFAGYVISDNINMRSSGSKAGKKIGTLMDGEEVQVLQNKNGWYQIEKANRENGWIRSDFVGPKSLSYGIKMTAFAESTVRENGVEMFIDKSKPYAIVYMIMPDEHYRDKMDAENFARKIGLDYQKKVYPGNVEIRILEKDRQKLFTKVSLPKKGVTNLKAPFLRNGRTFDFIIHNKNEIEIQVLISTDLTDKTLLNMCDEISLNYGDEVRKIEIYFVEDSEEGRKYFLQDDYKPSNKNICRFYFLEDNQGPYYKSKFCN